MDKYEYQVCADQIKLLISEKRYVEAMNIADTIDWRRVKSVSMLCTVSEIYKINKRYEESMDILLLAYDRYPNGRTIVYALCELAIKLNDIVMAVEYYKEFVQIAPEDTSNYILLYKIYEAQEVSLEERIEVLQEFKKRDYREKWAYELAKLYHKIGQETRCIQECDELILWFGEGRYVKKAMELKMEHTKLSSDQQLKYEGKQERVTGHMQPVNSISQQIPNLDQGPDVGVPQQIPYGNASVSGYGEPLSEYDSIEVRPVNVGMYNTMDLQSGLSENIKEFFRNQHLSQDTNVMYSGDPALYNSLYEQNTLDIPQDDRYELNVTTADTKEEPEIVVAPVKEENDEDEDIGITQYMPPRSEIRQAVDSTSKEKEAVDEANIDNDEKCASDINGNESNSNVNAGSDALDEVYGENGQLDRMDEDTASALEEELIRAHDAAPCKNETIDEVTTETNDVSTNDIATSDIETNDTATNDIKTTDIATNDTATNNIETEKAEKAIEESTTKEDKDPLDLKDVLVSWEEKKRASERKRIEEAKRRSLQQTADIMAQLKGVLPEIESIAKPFPKPVVPVEDALIKTGISDVVSDKDGNDTKEEPNISLESENEEETAAFNEVEDEEVTGVSNEVEEKVETEISDEAEDEEEAEASDEAEDEEAETSNEAEDEEEIETSNEADGMEETGASVKLSATEEFDNVDNQEVTEQFEETDAVEKAGYVEEVSDTDIEDAMEKSLESEAEDLEIELENSEEMSDELMDKAVMEAISKHDLKPLDEDDFDIKPIDISEEIIRQETAKYAKENDDSAEEDKVEDTEEKNNDALTYAEDEEALRKAAMEVTSELPRYPYEGLDDYGEVEELETINQPDELEKIIKTSDIPIDEVAKANYEAGLEEDIDYSSEDFDPRYETRKHPSYMKFEKNQTSKRDFDKEEKRIFGRFDGIEWLKAKIVDAIDEMSMNPSKGNVIIMGSENSGKRGLAVDFVKVMQVLDNEFKGKVAKISGEALNKKDIPLTLKKLKNGALIVENADGLTASSARIIAEALELETEPILVVFEGTIEGMQSIIEASKDIMSRVFNARVELQDYSTDDLVSYGKGYAKELEYAIDEMGVLALYTKIGDMQSLEHSVSLEEVSEIIDNAIKHVDKKNMSHFMDVLFSKRYDEEDFIILREKDFNT